MVIEKVIEKMRKKKVNTFPRLMKGTPIGKISQQDKALFLLKNKGKSNHTRQHSGGEKKTPQQKKAFLLVEITLLNL